MKKLKAFTLAEVLITLAIIGIVSALTIPALITKIQEKQNIAKWRKEYSIINQAFRKTMSDNVTIAKDGIFMNVGYTNEFMNSMLENLKVINSCGNESSTKNSLGLEWCTYPLGTYTKGVTWNGISSNSTGTVYGSMKAKYDAGGSISFYDFSHYAFLLADGAVLYFGGEGSGMVIAVDVNSAASGPNQLGKDFFAITILNDNKQGYYLAPLGAPGTKGANDNTKGSSGCSPDIGEIKANQLYQAAGAGCSYYYLYNK